MQPVRLDLILREIVVRSTNRYSSLAVQLNVDHGVNVMADPTRITQVFDNLLSNAVKYAPGSPVKINVTNNNEIVTITVEDQGPGIAENHLPHLFERFYRVPETSVTQHGTGLGLFICQLIINGHGGEISVSSEISKGTVFTINLPCKGNTPDTQPEGEEPKA
jgi:two-component system, OmpR family, sensor histidine kinase VicK